VLSRLSRSGVRATLQQVQAGLQGGEGWARTGVLERSLGDAPRRPPADWLTDADAGATSPFAAACRDWLTPADAAQLALCQLDASTPALWHARAAWIKPAALVGAWLNTPGVQFQAGSQVARLVRNSVGYGGDEARRAWQLQDDDGRTLATAELVVLAAGWASASLAVTADLADQPDVSGVAVADVSSSQQFFSPAVARAPCPLALQSVRGQVLCGVHEAADFASTLPPFPVNGMGSLIPKVPLPGEPGDALKFGWLCGATYERASADDSVRPEDDDTNKMQLRALLPRLANVLLGKSEGPAASTQAWAGVRCTTPTHLPSLGPLHRQTDAGEQEIGGVWVCTGMGSRGLTFSALCAELLAARIHGEPLPVEDRLARAMLPRYAAAASHSNFPVSAPLNS